MICFNHKIKIITHLHIDHLAWIEDKDVKDDIKEAREKIKTDLKPGQHPGGSKEDNIGVAYDCPDAKGFGGTTTTAEMARKVYGSQVLRRRLINFCPPLYRSAMDRILFNDLILMRLMSCDYRLL